MLVRDLLGLDLRPQIVVITGRNAALKERMDRFRTGRLRVEGYVEDVASFLAACDVFVGKAGPASVYEAIAVGRPMLITGYAGLNELGVLRFVERNGLGRHARTPGAVIEGARRYASDPALLEEVARRCRAVDLKSATERLAHHVARYAASPVDQPAAEIGRWVRVVAVFVVGLGLGIGGLYLVAGGRDLPPRNLQVQGP